MTRPGDPLDVQAGLPPALRTRRLRPAIAREHGEIYLRGYLRGLAAPIRRRTPRRVWAAAILATIALALAAFWAGRAYGSAATSEAQGGSVAAGNLSTATAASLVPGAPSVTVAMPSGAPFDPSSFPPIGYGVPNPSKRLGDASSGSNPAYTPEPERTVSHGTPGDGIAGQATWFDIGPGIYAAMPGHVWRHTTYAVVCAFPNGQATCQTVPVTDFCACGGQHVIDLSPLAFTRLLKPDADEPDPAILARGVVRVTVEPLK